MILAYLDIQKVSGEKLHNQIENALRELENLGLSRKKIDEIRKSFL